MASPPIKRGKDRAKGKPIYLLLLQAIPLLPRRLAAWTLEVYLVAASAVIPYSLGVYIESHSSADRVPLNPVLANAEKAIAQTLGLPRRQSQPEVAPLTNLLWWVALTSPVVLTSWQLYILGKTGQTLPKRWFGVRAIADSGKPPGLLRAVVREGAGKWGLPLGTAYLLWRYSGAFPNLGLLAGLAGVAIAIEGGILLRSSRRRPLHDRVAKTVVVDIQASSRRQRVRPPNRSVTVEVKPYNPKAIADNSHRRLPPDVLNAVVLPPESEERQKGFWLWMRQHPGTTLLIFTLAGMSFVLATFVVTQVYIQDKADRRQSEADKNEAFLTLVDRLSSTATDPLEERKSVILAMARLDDPRALSLLVDLLGQETNPALMDAIGRAMESVGLKALPALRQLNQSLSNQLQSLSLENAPQERRLVALRLRATKGAIARLLVLSSGRLSSADLQRIDLGGMVTESSDFALILDRADLSGANLRSALLSQASFRGTIFASAGEDRLLSTFDDAIADLSGADLREANLAEAFLSDVPLQGANLMLATLNRTNLSRAQLLETNLSSAQLLETNLTEADLEGASLTGADLAESTFVRANLRRAKLGRVRALGANFASANLFQSDWSGSDLSEVNFSQANLESADLSSTQLAGANLQKAQLQNANLANANLGNADLRGANLARANFQGVLFVTHPSTSSEPFLNASSSVESKANIEGVDFTDVKNLSDSQINFICTNGGYHPRCSIKPK
ncbi:transporter [Hydrococcus rivularis NIES-593]|uniref:Transporter n=1 Tax=Hydrococcus rivularis NIES-593 TaxID=1921803 RepID=A0A1U7HSX5_9CYAN|nr:pentapeptide repeat-containing protein [Hydrococcus rivularis]OKH26682.1 transporter [Hydrococcus rivularis NIES-593]